MKINSIETAIEAYVKLNNNEIFDIEFENWPIASFKIEENKKIALYTNELYGLLEIQKSINQQLFLINKGYAYNFDPRKHKNNIQLLYEFSPGSIKIDVNLEESLKSLKKTLSNLRKTSSKELVIIIVAGLLWKCDALYKIYKESEDKKIENQYLIEIKKLVEENHTLLELQNEVYKSHVKLIKSIRNSSALYIESSRLTYEDRKKILDNELEIENTEQIINDKFIISEYRHKEKDIYLFVFRPINKKEKYRIFVNLNIYGKLILEQLRDLYTTNKEFWSEITIKNGKIDIVKINNKLIQKQLGSSKKK